MRRACQGLPSLFRTHRNHKWGITCSSSIDFHVKTADHHVFLEMPRQDSTTEFLTEIIRQSKTKQIYSQFFNESTLSQWLSRYGNNKGTHTEQTVTVEEFDPLKHMNIEQTDTVVRATDCVDFATSFVDNLSAVSVRDVLPLPNHRLHISPSWDFLDKIFLGPGDSGESVRAIKKQAEIALCEEVTDPKTVSTREKFLRQCMAKREDQFIHNQPFTLFVGSWNVNGKAPPPSLESWLLVDKEPPDVYAIGFQELDNSKAVFFMDSPREKEWLKIILSSINSRVKYRKVRSIRLVGLLLVVFIQEKHFNYVRYADADQVPTGVMGLLGDKGGVSVRLRLHQNSLCFIDSHLAAHQHESKKRNEDYKEIFNKVKFRHIPSSQPVAKHDFVFWFGDLNYRIDLPIDEVKDLVKKRDYKRLFEADQLHREMIADAELFGGFEEGTLNFDPTYKYDPGTDIFDTSEKNRIPAWCDRILWRGLGVKQLRFSSHPEQKISDHKPISALFKLDVGVINEKEYKFVYEEVMKKLDRMELDNPN